MVSTAPHRGALLHRPQFCCSWGKVLGVHSWTTPRYCRGSPHLTSQIIATEVHRAQSVIWTVQHTSFSALNLADCCGWDSDLVIYCPGVLAHLPGVLMQRVPGCFCPYPKPVCHRVGSSLQKIANMHLTLSACSCLELKLEALHCRLVSPLQSRRAPWSPRWLLLILSSLSYENSRAEDTTVQHFPLRSQLFNLRTEFKCL